MRVCIISTVAPRQMSMYSIYVNYLIKKNIAFDLIYIDGFSGGDSVKSEETYRLSINNKKKTERYAGYIKFPVYVITVLKKKQYDYIIIWNELTAALLAPVLKRYYRGKYSVNIRDLFDENHRISSFILNKLLRCAVRYADFSTVSSEKYVDYLPSIVDYVVFHSLNENFKVITKELSMSQRKPITIMYIGNIRFIEKLKDFIRVFCNDPRYHLVIAGNGSDALENYCRYINCKNISFIGSFENEKTVEIVSKADILYNLYGTENACLRTALSQKLYLAISMHIPIIVYNNTYMYELANKCGIAFGVADEKKISERVPDELYNWYEKLDYNVIKEKCVMQERLFLECNTNFQKFLEEHIK